MRIPTSYFSVVDVLVNEKSKDDYKDKYGALHISLPNQTNTNNKHKLD